MRRTLWIALVACAMPLSSGCCWHCGCGHRLFCRPCMFGPCADNCGGGCNTCGYGGYHGPAPVAPAYSTPPPPPATIVPGGPMNAGPQIDKLSAVPTAKTIPTRIYR